MDGVTSLDDQLFLLVTDHIDVYSATSLTLSHCIALPGLSAHKWNDLTSCRRHRCLYVSDCDGKCVRRLGLDGSDSKWPVSNNPRGLWVTKAERNLLVTCVGARKLIVLNCAGDVVREVCFQPDVELPWHTVQLRPRDVDVQFVVVHGLAATSLHRVCFVDADGHVLGSFGGRRGSDVEHLNVPCHMAVDERTRSIYVADYYNRRVTQLSQSLEFNRTVVDLDHLSNEPRRLHFNHVSRRLYVGHGNSVCVVQL